MLSVSDFTIYNRMWKTKWTWGRKWYRTERFCWSFSINEEAKVLDFQFLLFFALLLRSAYFFIWWAPSFCFFFRCCCYDVPFYYDLLHVSSYDERESGIFVHDSFVSTLFVRFLCTTSYWHPYYSLSWRKISCPRFQKIYSEAKIKIYIISIFLIFHSPKVLRRKLVGMDGDDIYFYTRGMNTHESLHLAWLMKTTTFEIMHNVCVCEWKKGKKKNRCTSSKMFLNHQRRILRRRKKGKA